MIDATSSLPTSVVGLIATLFVFAIIWTVELERHLGFQGLRRKIIFRRTFDFVKFAMIFILIYGWSVFFLSGSRFGPTLLPVISIVLSIGGSFVLSVLIYRLRFLFKLFFGTNWSKTLEYPYLGVGLLIFYDIFLTEVDGVSIMMNEGEWPVWLSLFLMLRLAKTHLDVNAPLLIVNYFRSVR